MSPKPKRPYIVTTHDEIFAESPEAAAIEAARLWRTTRPQVFGVTPNGAATVFVRVERERATRVEP